MEVILSPDQKKASEAIIEFIKNPSTSNRGGSYVFTMGGFAGCGKTFTIAATIKKLKRDGISFPIAYCAFAGKAASVLKTKLDAHALLSDQDYCGTIHGLIYTPYSKEDKVNGKSADRKEDDLEAPRRPVLERSKMDVGFTKKDTFELSQYKLIVIDEASMVNERIYQDLTEFNIPILAVGDHGQLPPVGGDFNLMENPMIRLEHIHRQAEGDPIINLSMMARESGRIPIGKYGEFVEKIQARGDHAYADRITRDTVILCGTNATRVWWNDYLRGRWGFKSIDPEIGERVICLKNNKNSEIYNGMMGTILSIQSEGKHWYWLRVQMDAGNVYLGRALKHQFGSVSNLYQFTENGRQMMGREIGDLFDWAYCITTHKSQGSEWNDVVVMEERMGGDNDQWKRWLYTATTRSKKRLLIVGS